MSKVICDVCGTSFHETADRCPICGCAKSPAAQVVASDEMEHSPESTTAGSYVKGGRFSKSNVKRTNTGKPVPTRSSSSGSRSHHSAPQSNNKALIAVVIILLLAIIMVVVYIGVKVLNNTGNNNSNQNQSVGDTVVPCTGLTVDNLTYLTSTEFKIANSQYQISYTVVPEDTTDEVIIESSNPNVVTVTDKNMIVPIGYGQATITVRCGDQSVQFNVVSKIGEDPTSVPTTPTKPAVPAGFKLKLSTYKDSGEITIAGDATATLYKETMGVKPSDITWTTSDPSIATVENGKVTGVGKGHCYITATIGNQTATCKVICTSDAAPPSDYKISHVDVTISVGETFNLSLRSKETGANVQGIEWQASQEGIVSIDGNKITGKTVAWSGVNVFVEYEGVKYTCRVIVKPA